MSLGSLTLGLVVLGILFGILERIFPGVSGQRLFRQGRGTDIAYWFFTPLVTRALSRGALIAAVLLLALRARVPLDAAHIQAFLARGERGSTFAQVVLVLLLGDLIGYLVHRLFHRRFLWRFHAVHHSSVEVDWLSSVRLHPVNDLVSRLAQVLPFVLLGFNPFLLAAYLPFLTVHAILLHANLSWTFGPLRYVVSSPAFHRWHHTTQAEGLDTNFAGLFPFIDLLFGTFYMPEGRRPEAFGIRGEAVPEGLFGQLAYPFTRRPGLSAGGEPGPPAGVLKQGRAET
jgi:sterol desaturase/sphingolipid hydroxylase (fatty acid hydroxylase superfamily)